MEELLTKIKKQKIETEKDNEFLEKFIKRVPKVKYETIEPMVLVNILNENLEDKLNSKKKVLTILDEIIEKVEYVDYKELNISISGENKQIDDELLNIILRYVDKKLFSNQTFFIDIIEKLKTVEDISCYSIRGHKNNYSSNGQRYEKNISVEKIKTIFKKIDKSLWNNLNFIKKLEKSCETTLVYQDIHSDTGIYEKSEKSKVYIPKEIFTFILEKKNEFKKDKKFITKFC